MIADKRDTDERSHTNFSSRFRLDLLTPLRLLATIDNYQQLQILTSLYFRVH